MRPSEKAARDVPDTETRGRHGSGYVKESAQSKRRVASSEVAECTSSVGSSAKKKSEAKKSTASLAEPRVSRGVSQTAVGANSGVSWAASGEPSEKMV
ncbi:unnamed protein product [Chondrus crispus]|uniref:Uncharacterized protein n=1 Tax=Chondrus crispus TaxID=2769 RepID=R7QF09_CHOCR|nr:unnamed protein product [Chondrus crispus]CDF35980.1 unnamed protein product [Chondrus crispus]|eukprot:XP_005715799.1 unnamed protein product [Chondrus crispus]